MTAHETSNDLTKAVDQQRRLWEREAPRYDKKMELFDRFLLGDARQWACGHATGDTLEVAIGTGRNLSHYPVGVRLTGLDLSPAMLDIARTQAAGLGRGVELHEGDAHALPYPEASFDAVVCTFSLCNIPDNRLALTEMRRVLRPGGLLILADHVAATSRTVLIIQQLLETLTRRLAGDHQTRRQLPIVTDLGFTVENAERYKKGVVERLTARKPIPADGAGS